MLGRVPAVSATSEVYGFRRAPGCCTIWGVTEPPAALQEAVALLTAATSDVDDLPALVRRAIDEQGAEELVLAVTALGRSLCFTAARLVHAVDDDLSDDEAVDLTDAAVRPAAIAVLQRYAAAVARHVENERI